MGYEVQSCQALPKEHRICKWYGKLQELLQDCNEVQPRQLLSQADAKADAKAASLAEALASKRPRLRKMRSRKHRQKLQKADSRQDAEPAEASAAMQQDQSCAANVLPSGPAEHASARSSDGAEAAKALASPSCPSTTQADAPESALSGRPGSPKVANNPDVLPHKAADVPEPSVSGHEDEPAPSPLPSCFTAISVDKAQEMVQGLANDLNSRPIKFALETAAEALVSKDTSNRSPGLAWPSADTAHASSRHVAADPGQALRVDDSKTVHSPAHEVPTGGVSPEAAKATRLSKHTGHVQASFDTRATGQEPAATAHEPAVLSGKGAPADAVTLDKAAQDPTLVLTQSASQTGKVASAGVPAGPSTVAPAAVQPVTPATSSNASQQCNADAHMVSSADCQQDVSIAQRGQGGNLQASQNPQAFAALDQDKVHSQQDAVIGGSHQGSHASQAIAGRDQGSTHVTQPAAQDFAHPAAPGLDRLEHRLEMSPVQRDTADATASKHQEHCQPRKRDRRKSSVPAR